MEVLDKVLDFDGVIYHGNATIDFQLFLMSQIFKKNYSKIEKIYKFWDHNYKKITTWYQEEKSPRDIWLSASERALLEPAAIILDVPIENLICSEHLWPFTKWCYGQKKLLRILEKYPDAIVKEYFYDSCSDEHLLPICQNAFKVNHKPSGIILTKTK